MNWLKKLLYAPYTRYLERETQDLPPGTYRMIYRDNFSPLIIGFEPWDDDIHSLETDAQVIVPPTLDNQETHK